MLDFVSHWRDLASTLSEMGAVVEGCGWDQMRDNLIYRLTGSLRLHMRTDCGWGQNGSPGSNKGVTITQVRGQGGLDGVVVMEW